MDDEKVEGYWWLPGADEHAVPGVLTIEANGKLSLSLIGAFDRSRQELRAAGVAFGKSLKGELYTLFGLSLASSRTWGFSLAPQKQVLRADRLLKDIHLDDDDAPVFSSARVRIENLDVWSGFACLVQSGDNDPNAKVPTHEPVEFEHDGFTFRLRHLVGRFDFEVTRGGVDVACPTSVVLDIEAAQPTSVSGFDSAIFSWVDLLTFVTRETCALRSVLLVHESPKRVRRSVLVRNESGSQSIRPETVDVEHKIEMRARWSSTPKVPAETKVNQFEFALPKGDRTLEDWYRSWMAFRCRAERGIDMLLSLTYGSNTFLESDLLVVALGAETLHRNMYPDCLAMQPRDFEKMINTATGGLDAEDAERIKRSIRNEPSYSDRLRDLAAIPCDAAVRLAVPDVPDWSTELAKARNGLAHGLRKTNSDVQHMYNLSGRTRLLLELVVMAEIGVSDTDQEHHALEHQITS